MSFGIGGCVRKLNGGLSDFEITVEIRNGNSNDMLFVRENIDMNGEEFIVDWSEEHVE